MVIKIIAFLKAEDIKQADWKRIEVKGRVNRKTKNVNVDWWIQY